MSGNNATGAVAGSVGLGGGLHMADTCTNGICSTVELIAESVSFTSNSAAEVRDAPDIAYRHVSLSRRKQHGHIVA